MKNKTCEEYEYSGEDKMNSINELVPPLELCKKIPVGEFEDSAEQWKTIPEWDRYQVSTTGKVRSIDYKRTGQCKELKPSVDKFGYMRVCLTKNGKCFNFLVHQLVAKVFISNPYDYREVDHIDTNPANNNICNLRWCSSSENKMNILTRKRNSENNHWKGKTGALMHNSKAVLCVETGEIFGAMTEAERKTGIAHEDISACCRGKKSKAGGLHWKTVAGIGQEIRS